MTKIRFLLLFLLISGIALSVLILINEKPNAPFSRSLAPLFQELGKPIKSADRVLSRLYPVEEIDEKILGDEIKLSMKEAYKPKTSEEEKKVEYLNSLISILSQESTKPFDYQVFLLDGPPNAFSLPGGALGITKQMLNRLDNEAEIVAILAHEMGHVERGHLFDDARGEMLQRKVGNISILSFVSDLLHKIGNLSFSKAQEDEADEYAFQMLILKGYDPMALSTALEKLQKSSKSTNGITNPVDDFFRSHPYTEHRIEKFRSRANQRK